MQKLIESFPQQLAEALKIGEKISLTKPPKAIQKVLIAGMGGSGIGANFVAAFSEAACPVPIFVQKGYHLPAWVDKHTLCIASSYSGNTEETLSCLEAMMNKNAWIVCISSNGKMEEIAHANDLDFVKLPAGIHSPRACLGYSMIAQLAVLEKLNLIEDDFVASVQAAIRLLKKDQKEIQQKADRIAFLIQDKIPIIYTVDKMEPVAMRFRQQLNENAKMLAWHHVIPEMNHNELVGWRTEDQRLATIFLRNADDYPRNQVRLEIVKEVVGNFTDAVIQVFSKGNSQIARSIYLVHLTDWISLYLAKYRNMDVIEIEVINYLKKELAKQ